VVSLNRGGEGAVFSRIQAGVVSELTVSHVRPSGPYNTEISGEDGAIPAVAGFVSFNSLLHGALRDLRA
jgi:hypothetical protein